MRGAQIKMCMTLCNLFHMFFFTFGMLSSQYIFLPSTLIAPTHNPFFLSKPCILIWALWDFGFMNPNHVVPSIVALLTECLISPFDRIHMQVAWGELFSICVSFPAITSGTVKCSAEQLKPRKKTVCNGIHTGTYRKHDKPRGVMRLGHSFGIWCTEGADQRPLPGVCAQTAAVMCDWMKLYLTCLLTCFLLNR